MLEKAQLLFDNMSSPKFVLCRVRRGRIQSPQRAESSLTLVQQGRRSCLWKTAIQPACGEMVACWLSESERVLPVVSSARNRSSDATEHH